MDNDLIRKVPCISEYILRFVKCCIFPISFVRVSRLTLLLFLLVLQIVVLLQVLLLPSCACLSFVVEEERSVMVRFCNCCDELARRSKCHFSSMLITISSDVFIH